MIENKVLEEYERDNYNRLRKIRFLNKLIKIDDKFLQVRLVSIQKWKDRSKMTSVMPRAKFVQLENTDCYYLISKNEFLKLKEK